MHWIAGRALLLFLLRRQLEHKNSKQGDNDAADDRYKEVFHHEAMMRTSTAFAGLVASVFAAPVVHQIETPEL